MPSTLPFRWVNPFAQSSAGPSMNDTLHLCTTLTLDANTDPRAIAQAALYDYASHVPDFDNDEGSTGDGDVVVEYHSISHIRTEYGTVVQCRQWTRVRDQENDQVAEQAQKRGRRPILRRGSAYASFQAMLRRLSWGPSSSSSSSTTSQETSLSSDFVLSKTTVSYNATPEEAPEEDPLAFAKASVVEVRQGETEQISPASLDVKLGK